MFCSTPHCFFHLMLTNISFLVCYEAQHGDDQDPPWVRIYRRETDKSKHVAQPQAFSTQCRQSWYLSARASSLRWRVGAGLWSSDIPLPTDFATYGWWMLGPGQWLSALTLEPHVLDSNPTQLLTSCVTLGMLLNLSVSL